MGSIRIKKIYARRGEEDKVFSSVTEAAEFVNGIKHMVYKCCEGKKRYHHGWQFSYIPFEPIDKTEEWRDVVGFEGKYQVSNKGNVRTFQRDRCMPLKQKNTLGYMTVMLWDNKVRKDAKVHRLVAEAFIPNPDNLPVINHKDENPSNNVVDNLEWCTYEYNNNYGSFKEKHSKAFKNYPKFSKPIIQMTLDGKFIQEFPSIAEAARQLNGNYVNIAEYLREPNKRNHAYGYKWKYKGID